MGADTFAARCMPPVLHVTLGKLARRIQHNLVAQALRLGHRKCHAVL